MQLERRKTMVLLLLLPVKRWRVLYSSILKWEWNCFHFKNNNENRLHIYAYINKYIDQSQGFTRYGTSFLSLLVCVCVCVSVFVSVWCDLLHFILFFHSLSITLNLYLHASDCRLTAPTTTSTTTNDIVIAHKWWTRFCYGFLCAVGTSRHAVNLGQSKQPRNEEKRNE